ncbi:MAG: ribosome maturation protein [Thermoplasmata archaeon]|jgi:ribosome maturation protein SDO1|nr:ribosome maturation protein [Thermoplasmata archaeon]
MVSLEKAVVARLSRFGTHYEVLVDPDLAEAARAKLVANEKISPDEFRKVTAVDTVFTHWSDGKKASEEQLTKAFETTDFSAIARRILLEGEVQLTAEQRKKMAEQKHKRIVETILRNAWNPQTKTPHPRDRIERALEEAKFKVDPQRHVEEQVEAAMKLLRPLLPIAFERVRIAIKVPAEHAGHTFGVIKSLGELQKDEWQPDGSLVCIIEIPAGMQPEVYDRLNSTTHGHVETKLLT